MKLPINPKGLLLAASLAVLASAANAQEAITLKLADQFPLTHVGSKLGSQALIAGLEKRSGGMIKIQHFPAEQIAKAAGLLDAVRNRVTDMAMVGMVYNTDKLPLTSAAELPGLYTSSEHGSGAFNSYITTDLLEQEYLKLGVRPLYGLVTPPYQLMMGDRTEVGDVSSIEGLKLRVAGATGELIAKSLGAVPVKVPASDLYLALQRGTVNGAIFNPPSVFGYKVEEVLKGSSNNASLGTTAFALLVNENVWQGLTSEQQQILQEVADTTRINFSKAFDKANSGAYTKLSNAGVTVFELSPEMLEGMDTKLETVRAAWVEQLSARGLPAQEMLDRFKGHLAQ